MTSAVVKFAGEVWGNLALWERVALLICSVVIVVCLGWQVTHPAPILPPLFHEVPATTAR